MSWMVRPGVWLLGAALLACDSDNGSKEVEDAANEDTVNEAEASDGGSDTDAQHPDEEAADAGEDTADGGEDAPDGGGGARLDAGGSAHAGGGDEDGGASEPDADDTPYHDLGAHCHEIDFDGPLPYVAPVTVDALWSPAAGGQIMPGKYDLVSEERYVHADIATEQETLDCEQFLGLYWQRLVFTDKVMSNLVRYDDSTVAREIFDYDVDAGKLVQTLTCPDPDPNLDPTPPRAYSASADQLIIFDYLLSASMPDREVCEYKLTYMRKP